MTNPSEEHHLNELKCAGHELFERLYTVKRISRSDMYNWLAKRMKLEEWRVHFAEMNKSQCIQAINVMNKEYELLKNNRKSKYPKQKPKRTTKVKTMSSKNKEGIIRKLVEKNWIYNGRYFTKRAKNGVTIFATVKKVGQSVTVSRPDMRQGMMNKKSNRVHTIINKYTLVPCTEREIDYMFNRGKESCG